MPRLSTRSSPTPGTASVPTSTPAPAAPPALRPERGSAHPLPVNTARADLPRMVRAALGTPPVCDPDRVLTADGRSCSESDRTELAYRFSNLIAYLEPVPGAHDWLQVLRASASTEYPRQGSGSTAFRIKAAKRIITKHAVNLALHHGVLLATTDCVLLHGAEEREADIAAGTYRSGAAGTNTERAAPPAPSASSNIPSASASSTETSAEAPSAGTAAVVMTQHDRGGMVDGAGDRALVDLLLTQHSNHEMHTVLAPLVKTLRNADGRASWYDFDRKLRAAAELTFDLGLEEERSILDSTMFRGKRLIDQGGHPRQVLYLFTEKLPNVRGVDREQLAMDKAVLKGIVKASGALQIAGGGVSNYTPPPARPSRFGPAFRPTSGRAAYPSTTPHQGPPPRAMHGYTLPAGQQRTKGQRRGGKAFVGTGGKGGQGPPGTPSNRDVQKRERHNRQLEELQQSYKPVQGAPTCDNCARASRNPNHHHKQCAFSVCRTCKLGGHRANVCPN